MDSILYKTKYKKLQLIQLIKLFENEQTSTIYSSKSTLKTLRLKETIALSLIYVIMNKLNY